jgi:hypothetical protein
MSSWAAKECAQGKRDGHARPRFAAVATTWARRSERGRADPKIPTCNSARYAVAVAVVSPMEIALLILLVQRRRHRRDPHVHQEGNGGDPETERVMPA